MTLNNCFIRFSYYSIHALRNDSELTEGASHFDPICPGCWQWMGGGTQGSPVVLGTARFPAYIL
jgi:hypothetical protein